MQNSVLDDLSATVGFTATVALLTWYGGRRLYVPDAAIEGHALAKLIGLPALRALVRDFRGDDLCLPSADAFSRYARDRDIAASFAAGMTPAQTAEKFGLSLRRCEQLREEMATRGVLVLLARRAARPGRPRRGRSPYLGAEILGTGEVSAATPGA